MTQEIEAVNRGASNSSGARSNFLYGNILEQKRYIFVLDKVRNLDVLDCASGIGWGSFLIARAGARRVVGVELSDEAVVSATKYYSADNVEYINSSLAESGLPAAGFDVVVSFETLEHVASPVEFLKKLRLLARRDATMFLSTPNAHAFKNDGEKPANPYHLDEYTRDEVVRMCQQAGWAVVEYRGQHPMPRGSDEIPAYRKFIKAYWTQHQRAQSYGIPYRLLTFVARKSGFALAEPAFMGNCNPVLVDQNHEPAYHYLILSAV